MAGFVSRTIKIIAPKLVSDRSKQKSKSTGSSTDILPAVDFSPLGDAPKKEKTRRLPRQEWLIRSPLVLEFVSSGAIAAPPSPNLRPGLIGKTIAGGARVKGATTTADAGLRTKPSGFGIFGNIRRKGKKRNRKKR